MSETEERRPPAAQLADGVVELRKRRARDARPPVPAPNDRIRGDRATEDLALLRRVADGEEAVTGPPDEAVTDAPREAAAGTPREAAAGTP
ncbi:hypothetical protein ACFWUQ_16740 [Streptomyces sp. NPDC058662]|uniref:hypothetical protein n=1 Tax=Streptomyces sp. NPDC058662 TaxID=3346583 RepID=UPI003647CDF3